MPWLRFDVRLLLRLAYCGVIALATLAHVGMPVGAPVHSMQKVLRVPFTLASLSDAVRNMVLFGGWGVVWVASASPGTAKRLLRNAALSGLLLSATVEGLQLFSRFRNPSIRDLVANTIGALIGGLFVVVAVVFVRAARGARSFVGVPAAIFALPYTCVVLLHAFAAPFRVEYVAGFEPDLAALQPGLLSVVPWLDLALFAPAGAFIVAMLVEFGSTYTAAGIIGAIAGSVAMLAAELSRSVFGVQSDWKITVAHMIAIATAALLAARSLPRMTVRLRGGRRSLALLIGYAALIALWSLRPFIPEAALSDIFGKLTVQHFVPLYIYREEIQPFAVFDVVLAFLLFLPIGGLLAAWPLRLHGILRGLLPGVYFAIGLTFSQIFIRGHSFDVTQGLVCSAAVGLGWAVVRRAGIRPYGQMLRVPVGPPPTAASQRSTGRGS